MTQMRISILLFPGFDELDAIGPYEVFRHAARLAADVDVRLVTLDGDPDVTASGGLQVRSQGRLAAGADVVVVPGGGWNDRAPEGAWAQAQRGDLPTVLQRLHASGTTIATVCTGGMLAAAAGLTVGRPATTHHTALHELRASGARVVEARVVDDGDLLTAAGVTSGIEVALWLVERHFGRQIADAVAAEMEFPRSAHLWRRNEN